jgi:hypothetical protein
MSIEDITEPKFTDSHIATTFSYLGRLWEFHWNSVDKVCTLFLIAPNDDNKNIRIYKKICEINESDAGYPSGESVNDAAKRMIMHYSTKEYAKEVKYISPWKKEEENV